MQDPDIVDRVTQALQDADPRYTKGEALDGFWIAVAGNAIEAHEAALAAAGLVIVPREPTEAMVDAGFAASGPETDRQGVRDGWRAMIAATRGKDAV